MTHKVTSTQVTAEEMNCEIAHPLLVSSFVVMRVSASLLHMAKPDLSLLSSDGLSDRERFAEITALWP